MERSIINPALSLFMKHLFIGQRQKAPNFSAFHWSPHGSLVSIGQHFVTTKVVHLPKRTETSLITESDQSGPNHQLLQLCTSRTAWSDSDQAVRACIAAIAGLVYNYRLPLTSLPPVFKHENVVVSWQYEERIDITTFVYTAGIHVFRRRIHSSPDFFWFCLSTRNCDQDCNQKHGF